MNPKKSKDILKDLYSELDMDQALVKDAIDFYWENVRKSISSIAYCRINVENLGVFQVKSKSLTKSIVKYSTLIKNFERTNFSNYPRYQSLTERLSILEKTKQEIFEENERRKEIKCQKKDNTSGSLEEEGKDS